MDTDTVTLFLAILAVVAEAAVAATVLLAAGRRAAAVLDRAAAAGAGAVRSQALPMALCVAGVATAGSLYLSEVAHFVPCRLCWVQRACMYPLVPILAVAARRGHRRAGSLRPMAAAFSAVGGAVSSYHILLERFPTLESDACDPANPCTLIWVRHLGYLTIPTMALSAFALILTLLALSRDPD